MILNFKVKIKSNYQETYNYFLKELNLKKLSCPCCKAKGRLKKHALYDRHVVGLIKGKLTCEILSILRVRCGSCRRTHALLPDFIIPYHSYAYHIILQCLNEKFNYQKVHEICDKYNISFQLLYAWIKRYKEHQGLGSLVFEKGTLSLTTLLIKIRTNMPSFLVHFYNEHQYMFMQIRRSP